MKPTFEQQFNKITSAYVNGTLDPYRNCACFIGNMLNEQPLWAQGRLINDDDNKVTWIPLESGINIMETGPKGSDEVIFAIGQPELAETAIQTFGKGLYTMNDIMEMECNFLTIYGQGNETEDALFEAMTSTLEMLRQIHIRNGENLEPVILAKRQLVTA